jgi:Rhs element Vgr protein
MPSLETNAGSVATFTVKVAGNTIPDVFNILSVSIEKRINRIPTAIISILDGEANTGKFDASSSSTFIPGAELTIEAGYDSTNALIFKGIITRQTIKINQDIGSLLEVECRDKAVKMIVGRKSLTYSAQKDSDIISSIIGTYSGLTSDVTDTTTTWPEMIQYYVTDWDFILSRAETNGLIVIALNNKITVGAPDADTTAVITVTFGEDMLEFNADLNTVSQIASAKASAWNYKTQAVISGEAANNVAGPGNLSSTTLSQVVGLSDYALQTTVPLETTDLTNWSKAQLIKSEYSKIQGEVKFQGSSLVDPGKYITLAGVGDRFNGDHIISGVVHTIADGNWTTDALIGLSDNWFIEERDVMAPSASGVLPGVRGLFNATVKQMNADPDSQYRILVDVPLFDASGKGIWARLTNFYSSNGVGVFFLPEVGDEVILGFLNEDPRYPIILGSVYSSSTLIPYAGLDPDEKNSKKAIVSKSKIFIQFDDENVVFTIQTPGKNSVVLDDKANKLSLTDSNGNSIVMSSDGIKIKSVKDIIIEATNNVTVTGPQGIKINSSAGDVTVSGVNIKETADVQYSAEGTGTAKVTGGTQLTLKGAMVMIN